MRQFDVFVFDENFDESLGKCPQPPFSDKELAWFYTNKWNKHLDDIDGEWVVFAHPSIRIDRDFLNNVAEVTDSFPMVDAFAPRIRTDKGNFLGGFLLKPAAKGSGFVEIDENLFKTHNPAHRLFRHDAPGTRKTYRLFASHDACRRQDVFCAVSCSSSDKQ